MPGLSILEKLFEKKGPDMNLKNTVINSDKEDISNTDD